jgi:hypothetical protein
LTANAYSRSNRFPWVHKKNSRRRHATQRTLNRALEFGPFLMFDDRSEETSDLVAGRSIVQRGRRALPDSTANEGPMPVVKPTSRCLRKDVA